MGADDTAWLVLRIVYAWMYLYPAVGLIRDWDTTVQTTGLLFKVAPHVFAFASLVMMVVGAVFILLGIYGQWAAAGLLFFNLGGAAIHYRLAAMVRDSKLSEQASQEDQLTAQKIIALGVVGHVTSAEKNFVLAAVAFFFFLKGTGPLSLIPGTPLF